MQFRVLAIRIQPARHWHLSEASSFDVQWARALQKSLEAILPDWAIGWGHEQRDILLSLRRLVVQLRPRLGSPSSPLSHTARRAQQTDLSSNRGRRMTGVHRQRLCILQDFVATAFVVTWRRITSDRTLSRPWRCWDVRRHKKTPLGALGRRKSGTTRIRGTISKRCHQEKIEPLTLLRNGRFRLLDDRLQSLLLGQGVG